MERPRRTMAGFIGERIDLAGAFARDDAETLDMAHVVVVADPYLDVPLAFGPFAGPAWAAAFAERYRDDLRYDGCEAPATVTVIPLRHG